MTALVNVPTAGYVLPGGGLVEATVPAQRLHDPRQLGVVVT